MSENTVERHLRDHLTDGYWHDSCPYCQLRRVHGGTGVPSAASVERVDRYTITVDGYNVRATDDQERRTPGDGCRAAGAVPDRDGPLCNAIGDTTSARRTPQDRRARAAMRDE